MEAEQHNRLTRMWRFLRGTVPEHCREQFTRSKVQSNLRRTWVLALFIVCVQVALDLMSLLRPEPPFVGEKLICAGVFFFLLLGLGLLFFVLGVLARRGHLRNERLQHVLPFVLLYAYVGIQMASFAFRIPLEAGSGSMMIAMLVAGLFLVMPPLQTLLSLGSIFILQYGIVLFYRCSDEGLDLTRFADALPNTAIVTALIIYIACTMFDVYRHNFLNQLRLEGSNQQLEEIAQTDSLTGILNRRGFFRAADRDWGAYIARGKLVAVCMFDIDYFKKFNDLHGHLLGDECLCMVGQCLKRFFEGMDGGVVCRFGGEEFLAVFRGGDAETVTEAAWQACRAIREAELLDQGSGAHLRVTISGGLAYGSGECGCDALIRLADEALYRAKAEGRDRICVAEKCPLEPEGEA